MSSDHGPSLSTWLDHKGPIGFLIIMIYPCPSSCSFSRRESQLHSQHPSSMGFFAEASAWEKIIKGLSIQEFSCWLSFRSHRPSLSTCAASLDAASCSTASHGGQGIPGRSLLHPARRQPFRADVVPPPRHGAGYWPSRKIQRGIKATRTRNFFTKVVCI